MVMQGRNEEYIQAEKCTVVDVEATQNVVKYPMAMVILRVALS